jgi:hypothetical protein
MVIREEIENSSQYMKQLNKDLESKINIVEDENKTLKKNIKNVKKLIQMSDKLVECDLIKNKATNLENEIRYKDSIINYLESLLKKKKSKKNFNLVNPSLYDESKYQENFETRREKVEDSEYDFTKSNKTKKEDSPYRLKSSINDLNYSKTYSLKNEIDSLDVEIKELQSKLKNMIDVNK